MLTKHYTKAQRQALNQIWNSAGTYGFEPMFMAIDSKGMPDIYMNTVIGLVSKWYGEEMTKDLFGRWAGDHRQAMLDDLAWMALENAAYLKEVGGRPALKEARRAHAENFFAQEYQLSRQEWMAKNQLVYAIQSARWKTVLGKHKPVMTPYEKNLYNDLTPVHDEDKDELEKSILDTFKKYALFSGEVKNRGNKIIHFDGKWASVLTKFMPTEMVHTDTLSAGHTAGIRANEAKGVVKAIRRSVVKLNENPEEDRKYIEGCFGKSMYPPDEMAAIDRQLCTGDHYGCHLWFTAGAPSEEKNRNLHVNEESALQARRNREEYAKNITLYRSSILRLTEQIHNCIQVHSQMETEGARSGKLDISRVWRAEVLGDGRVFSRQFPADKPGFSVDILLDASASRMKSQEIIAAQGYILAESLRMCKVPVRVTGFCSLRGYTVLRIFKTFQDKNGGSRIFDYFASGWNRDGLALRGAGELLKNTPAERKLLLMLTDASPNDIHRIPPGNDHPLGCDYSGKAAVEDAAREVRALKKENVRVGAIFTGENMDVPAAEEIYGKNMARISTMDQLAGAAGALIRKEIQELTG